MVKKSELKYWSDITIDYMSQESDDTTNAKNIIVHNLPWRSEVKQSII